MSASEIVPYTGPARGAELRQNRAAHGNVTLHQRCSCGATREVNVNREHIEVGAWLVEAVDGAEVRS